MVDHSLMNKIDYMPSQNSTLGNIAANAGSLQMGMQDDKVDNSKSQSIQNFVSKGSREPLLLGAQDGREMGSNNNLVDCVVQSDYPENLDGSFLTLGVGVNTEAKPKSNASSKDFVGKMDGAINKQLNPSQGQSVYESSISPDFGMAVNLSDFQTYADRISGTEKNTFGLSSLKHNFGGLPSIVQNAGESSNASAFSGAVQNGDGCSLSEHHLGVSGNNNSNISLSRLQKLPMPQGHVSFPFLTPDDQKFVAGFEYIDPNLSGVSPNLSHISNQSRVPPNQGFYSLSGVTPIVHSSSKSVLAAQSQHRMATWPSLSSNMTSEYATLASDQLQKGNRGSISIFQQDTSMASPVLGGVKKTSNRYQSDQVFAYDQGASQDSSSVSISKNFGIQTVDQVFAYDQGASQVSSSVSISKNFVVQAAGQVIPPTRGRGPAMTPNLTGSSLRRKAAQPPLAVPQVQMKKTRSMNPSIRSSALYKAQNAPSVASLPPVVSQAAPVPSLSKSTSSVPHVNVTARRLPHLARKGPPPPSLSHATPVYLPPTQTALVPPSARMSPALHIRWQESELLQLSGHNCLLCKRDLSYTPEGPVSQPNVPPPVAVLACGHCFHDLCLLRITPEDQADNPPCIPCVVGES